MRWFAFAALAALALGIIGTGVYSARHADEYEGRARARQIERVKQCVAMCRAAGTDVREAYGYVCTCGDRR